MKWKYETYDQEVIRREQWRKHFALLPVRDDRGNAFWLEYVEKREVFISRGLGFRHDEVVYIEYRGIYETID